MSTYTMGSTEEAGDLFVGLVATLVERARAHGLTEAGTVGYVRWALIELAKRAERADDEDVRDDDAPFPCTLCGGHGRVSATGPEHLNASPWYVCDDCGGDYS